MMGIFGEVFPELAVYLIDIGKRERALRKIGMECICWGDGLNPRWGDLGERDNRRSFDYASRDEAARSCSG
jgi:hypothetical protein